MSANPNSAPPKIVKLYQTKRSRNRAILLAIFGICALFFVITIVRMG